MKKILTGTAAGAGLVGVYAANQSGKNPQTVVEMTVNAPIETAFHYIAPINLMHIFRGTALIPAIVDTSIKEDWNKAGLSRTIYFRRLDLARNFADDGAADRL